MTPTSTTTATLCGALRRRHDDHIDHIDHDDHDDGGADGDHEHHHDERDHNELRRLNEHDHNRAAYRGNCVWRRPPTEVEGRRQQRRTGCRSSGTFQFTYDAGGIPDQFDIYYEDVLIHTTGAVSGQNTVPVNFGPGRGNHRGRRRHGTGAYALGVHRRPAQRPEAWLDGLLLDVDHRSAQRALERSG